MNIGVFGATGRVGRLIVNLLLQDRECNVSTVFIIDELDFTLPPEVIATNDMEIFLKSCDVIIDFTAPEGTEELLKAAINGFAKPIVIGTTGLNTHQVNLIKDASSQMPILYATNMSFGVAFLNKIVYLASKALKDFDCEIVEMHHKHKKDAPSGTALTLAKTAADARELDIDTVRVSGRDGVIGARTKDEISVMSLRGGDIVGKHTVGFYSDGEFIELTHTATSRETFAAGAIRAAKWLHNRQNGLYSISDCLGVN